MKIVFMGTPEFAVPSLKMLVEKGEEVVAVICQPDRPVGRGNKVHACPVKEAAQEFGIEVYQPERIKREESVLKLKSFHPDLFITAAFGQILSKEILDIPKFGTINVHASLLPRHRGAAPINWAILCGDEKTGVTTMMTDVGMDTGEMLLKEETVIKREDTAETLSKRLAEMGAQVLYKTLEKLRMGTLERVPQDNAMATVEPKMTKELGCIDWSKGFEEVERLIRGTSPWPGAYSLTDAGTMKVFSLMNTDIQTDAAAGTIVCADAKKGLFVACGGRVAEILEMQMPGAKRMMAKDYLRGHKLIEGTILGRK